MTCSSPTMYRACMMGGRGCGRRTPICMGVSIPGRSNQLPGSALPGRVGTSSTNTSSTVQSYRTPADQQHPSPALAALPSPPATCRSPRSPPLPSAPAVSTRSLSLSPIPPSTSPPHTAPILHTHRQSRGDLPSVLPPPGLLTRGRQGWRGGERGALLPPPGQQR